MRRGQPWLFADSVDAPPGLASGAIVDVEGPTGNWLGRGVFDADSPLAVRIWTLDEQEPIDGALVGRRVEAAARIRRRLLPPELTVFRLVNGEGDRLPGLTCDVYGPTAVIQIDTPAVAALVQPLWAAARQSLPALRRAVVRQRTAPGRWLEGSPTAGGPLHVDEFGLEFEVEPVLGQKTGLYLDQRPQRELVRRLAAGADVLNLFAYTGGFTVAAAIGGAARVTSVEQARPAVESAARNLRQNGFDPDHGSLDLVTGDVFGFLADHIKLYDLVILDPPNMAPRANLRSKALGAYRRLNCSAIERVRPGGFLLTASCSTHITRTDLAGVLAEAGQRVNRYLTVVVEGGPGPDHPVPAGFPEARNLDTFLVRVE